MVAIDSNILVYSYREDSPWHEAAKKCVNNLARGDEPWAIPWPCYHEFLGVVTQNIYKPPSPIDDAIGYLEDLRASDSLKTIGEGPGYFEKMKVMAIKAKLKGAKIHDCKIAAICQNHGVKTLFTADRDFSLFPALKSLNPLIQ